MTKYTSLVALILAGSVSANADIVLTDFFPQSASATFKNDLFNNTWQSGDVFSPNATWFGPVYNYGLKQNADASLAEGTLYYDTEKGNAVGSGNEPSISTNTDDSVKFGISTTGQGYSCAAIWKSIELSDIANFKDLKFNVDITSGSSESTLSVAVFYLAEGATNPGNDTKRIAYTALSAGETWTSGDLLPSISGNGQLLVALRSDSDTAWRNPSPTVSWTATIIPEPSAFGLLAGIGALALVASRRRRK